MATINTNMSANIAANSMVRNERMMTSTMERLSTGLRINSAKDDAAGFLGDFIENDLTDPRTRPGGAKCQRRDLDDSGR